MRDLLGVTIDVADLLPSDGGDFGFDNIATALTTSPLLLERYLTAGLRDRRARRRRCRRRARHGDLHDQHRRHAEPARRRAAARHARRHAGPHTVPGRRRVRVLRPAAARPWPKGYVGVEGHETPHQFIVTIDGKQVFSAPIGGKDDHEPATENTPVSREEFDKRMTSPRIKVTAGLHDVGFTFVERPTQEQNMWQPVLRASQEAHNPSGMPRLRNGIIEGPYNVTGVSETPSRGSGCSSARRRSRRAGSAVRRRDPVRRGAARVPAARRRRPTWTRRWRSTATSAQARRRLRRRHPRRPRADPHQPGVPVPLGERPGRRSPAGAAHRVSELELASRLSFFLWSSIPDDELLNLAIAGRLRAPGVLEAQVRRMIADPRADALMTAFTGQWLQLRNLDKVTPDVLLFPDFDDNVRQAFRRETELLLRQHRAREPLARSTLLDADYTFVNERLARHYGIRGVYGSRFRRVPVTDPNRRGLLGHGSILSMTSVANRTSPVLRGKYIISNLLNTPPLPPPADRAAISRRARTKDRPSTVREQLERHRANPVCASCHRNIDPVGFALENFDAVGQWQNDHAGRAADRLRRRARRTARKVDGPVGAAQGAAGQAGGVRRHGHRKDADLRAGPRARAGRHAGRAQRREERGRAELRHAVDRAGDRAERPVPDADEVDRY